MLVNVPIEVLQNPAVAAAVASALTLAAAHPAQLGSLAVKALFKVPPIKKAILEHPEVVKAVLEGAEQEISVEGNANPAASTVTLTQPPKS